MAANLTDEQLERIARNKAEADRRKALKGLSSSLHLAPILTITGRLGFANHKTKLLSQSCSIRCQRQQ